MSHHHVLAWWSLFTLTSCRAPPCDEPMAPVALHGANSETYCWAHECRMNILLIMTYPNMFPECPCTPHLSSHPHPPQQHLNAINHDHIDSLRSHEGTTATYETWKLSPSPKTNSRSTTTVSLTRYALSTRREHMLTCDHTHTLSWYDTHPQIIQTLGLLISWRHDLNCTCLDWLLLWCFNEVRSQLHSSETSHTSHTWIRIWCDHQLHLLVLLAIVMFQWSLLAVAI
jgi:hypothetical protein